MAKRPEPQAEDALKLFKADLKAGTPANFYIFYGEEAFLREYYLSMLVKTVLDGPAADFNFHRFTADTLTPEALSAAVEAVPMMAERTLIQVDDVDLFKAPEQARAQYLEILSDLPDYCCLVFVYDTVEFKINGQMRKLADCIRKYARIVEFAKQSERDLMAWIARHFRAHGKTISDRNCQYLIFMTDGMMTTLASEIDKAAAYACGSEVTKGDLDAVVIPALNAQAFDISDAIVKGDFDLALRKTQELFAMQTEPLVILGAIGAQLRRLQYARMITGSGKGQETLMELTGLKSYPAGLTMSAARKVTDRFCRRAMELCLQADADMKRSFDDPGRILELLIVQLAQEARHG